MGYNRGLTIEIVSEALRETHGNVSLAARKLKVTRRAVMYYIKTYSAVRDVHDEAADTITDYAEGHLVSGVVKGEWDKVRYWLETKGRARGYGNVQRTEHTGKDGGPLDVQLISRSAALAAIAPGPVSDRDRSGNNQGDHDGS